MSASAVAMGAGLAATFLPQAILAWQGGGGAPAELLVQVAGGPYLGFAVLNWKERDRVIGGIDNRSVGRMRRQGRQQTDRAIQDDQAEAVTVGAPSERPDRRPDRQRQNLIAAARIPQT